MMISPWDLNIIGFLSFLLDDANRYLFLWRFVRFALSLQAKRNQLSRNPKSKRYETEGIMATHHSDDSWGE